MKRFGSLFAVLSLLSTLLVSCAGGGKTSGSPGGSTGTPVGTPNHSGPGFLATNYAPLAKWLDEAFDVDYKHMTPQVVFNQVPLNDIYYETSNLPTTAPPFNFASPSITRRDLLRKIAQHWNLRMSLVSDASGNPRAVKVEG